MKTSQLLVCTLTGLSSFAFAQPMTYSSFDTNADGWTLDGNPGANLSYHSSGGNPGGHLRFADNANPGSFWVAPAKFLGSWTMFSGKGVLAFDHRVFQTGDVVDIFPYTVLISGPGGSAEWIGSLPPNSTTPWRRICVSISPNEWAVTSGTWDGLLANVTSVMIRAEMYGTPTIPDIGGLDNVTLSKHVHTNLIANPGFESAPNNNQGSGLYAEFWHGRNAVGNEADTYSSDGSYGLRPSDFGNFPSTMHPHSGIRFMAAWATFPDAYGAEVLEQSLLGCIQPGRIYRIAAWLHESIRSGQDIPGGYQAQFFDGTNYVVLATLGPTSPPSSGWTQAIAYFEAPGNSAAFSKIRFRPINWPGSPTGDAYPAIDDVQLALAERVHGSAYLQDYLASVVGELLEVEVWQNNVLVETLDGNYGHSGSFAFSPTVNGEAVLKFRFRTGLWKAVPVTLDETPIENLTVNMTNGDCDGDNEVTLVDFGILASVFGKSVGDPGYDTRGDLDGDTEITLVDYGILAASFGQAGD